MAVQLRPPACIAGGPQTGGSVVVDNNHDAILHELFYGLGSTSDSAVVQRCHERWIDCFNRPRGALLFQCSAGRSSLRPRTRSLERGSDSGVSFALPTAVRSVGATHAGSRFCQQRSPRPPFEVQHLVLQDHTSKSRRRPFSAPEHGVALWPRENTVKSAQSASPTTVKLSTASRWHRRCGKAMVKPIPVAYLASGVLSIIGPRLTAGCRDPSAGRPVGG